MLFPLRTSKTYMDDNEPEGFRSEIQKLQLLILSNFNCLFITNNTNTFNFKNCYKK